MKIIGIQRKLLRNGYIFNVCMSTGNILAKKGQRSYIANSFNALYKQIFN